MDGIIFDWLTFSLKPDPLSENKRDVDLAFIKSFLCINSEFTSFENIGGRNGYPTCYTYNGVSLMCPDEKHYERMGYCVQFSGDGLAWYTGLFKNFSFSGFFKRLRLLSESGLSVNVSRLDVAKDDKSGILDLDVIIQKAEANEYISTSRTRSTIKEIMHYKGDKISGRTIYFGSRKSTSYIRIYDKAAEQGVAGHWIRVEYEFKQDTAMRIVNAIAELGDKAFPAYFSEVSNYYLRFIEMDDTNRSRCSLSGFWANFMQTVKKSKLAILKYKRQTLTGLFQHMLHAYSPSLFVLFNSLSPEFVVDLFCRNGKSRLKRRHIDMLKNPDLPHAVFSNSEKWQREVPASVYGQLALAGGV